MKRFYDSGRIRELQSLEELYMGRTFEPICRQYLLRKNAKDELPFLFESIGRWRALGFLRQDRQMNSAFLFNNTENY